MVDYTEKYNTKLSPQEEAAYQQWATENNRSKDDYDYDMRGAWKAGIASDPRGHFPDTYKKPNHPTFSDQSQYNGVDGYVGGHWSEDGKEYVPSHTNIEMYGQPGLERYFKEREPNTKLNAMELLLDKAIQ